MVFIFIEYSKRVNSVESCQNDQEVFYDYFTKPYPLMKPGKVLASMVHHSCRFECLKDPDISPQAALRGCRETSTNPRQPGCGYCL